MTNVFHLPGAKVGDARCNCVMCERQRVFPLPAPTPVAAETADPDFGEPCPCCKRWLVCYCHEYPHPDKPECPGNYAAESETT